MHMNWRLASRLSVITLAILVVVLVSILQQHKAGAPTIQTQQAPGANAAGLQGTNLGGQPAADFRLTDQFGKQVTLAQFRGKPVVLTFMYTSCPDQCPLTAEKLHTMMQSLAKDAQDVAVVAVSTDAKRDTVAAALKFSQVHSMQDYWHYLVGSQAELSSVWKAYSVDAQVTQQGQVNHSLGLYLIDKQGHERVFLGNDFTPNQLAKNLQILLKE